jgi:hypothetical protein
VALARSSAARRGRRLRARPHRGMVGALVRPLHVRGRVPRGGPDLADRAQGDDLGGDRRADRRAHHVSAGRPRRRAQLGLPLLLAPPLLVLARERAGGQRPRRRRRARSSSACSPCATTSGSWPRSTTSSAAVRSATSPTPSATWG